MNNTKIKHNPIVLSKEWKVVLPPYDKINGCRIEGLSIVTEDDMHEVVGCSEWMRASRETFEYICKIHNESLDQ